MMEEFNAYIMATPGDTLGQLRSNIHVVEYTGSILWSLCDIPGLPHMNYGRGPGHFDKWHTIAGWKISMMA